MDTRRRLGRGLDALIPAEETAGVRQVPLDQIEPNPHQPRHREDPESLRELAASIAAHGVIQPVVLTEVPGVPLRYRLIAGERRWRAARMAGLGTIPALIREVSSRQMLELALVENIQRQDLNPLEEAEAYRLLAEEFGLSHEEIAQQVGRSRPAVSNALRLLHLPPAVQEGVVSGELSAGHARALLALPDAETQVEAMRLVLKNGLNVRQTEALVKRLLRGRRAGRPEASSAVRAELAALEERLRESLGTRVALRHGRKGGRIVIHYYSEEELEHLLQRLGVAEG